MQISERRGRNICCMIKLKRFIIFILVLCGVCLFLVIREMPRRNYVIYGNASWYGEKESKNVLTANGEVYDETRMTAAHKSLPFGTYVLVSRLDCNKSITVRINDRGPFVRGRVIDLSRAAAGKLDLIEIGVAPVRIEILREEQE